MDYIKPRATDLVPMTAVTYEAPYRFAPYVQVHMTVNLPEFEDGPLRNLSRPRNAFVVEQALN